MLMNAGLIQVPEWLFWLGLAFVTIVIGTLLVPDFKRRLRAYRASDSDDRWLSHFGMFGLMVLCFVFGLIALMSARGPVMDPRNMDVHGDDSILPAFEGAAQREEQSLQPQTTDQLVREREVKETLREVQEQKDDLRANEQIDESMRDFRSRVMNRETPSTDDARP